VKKLGMIEIHMKSYYFLPSSPNLKKKKLKVLKDACGILINIFTNAFAGKGSNK